jgi:hypothetical protein
VILNSDLDPPRCEILDWMISASVAKWKFEGFASYRLSKNLMSKTDAEKWNCS